MNKIKIVFCMLLVMLFAVPGFSLMLRIDLDDLVRDAGVIATGRVVERECKRWTEKGYIYTYVTVLVGEYIKGEGGKKVVVRHPGGEVGKKGLKVSNMPSFRFGEEVLVFLKDAKQLSAEPQTLLLNQEGTGGIYNVSGLAQGKYHIFTDKTGKKMVRNNFSNLCVQDENCIKFTDEKVLSGKPLSEFVSEIEKIIDSSLRSE